MEMAMETTIENLSEDKKIAIDPHSATAIWFHEMMRLTSNINNNCQFEHCDFEILQENSILNFSWFDKVKVLKDVAEAIAFVHFRGQSLSGIGKKINSFTITSAVSTSVLLNEEQSADLFKFGIIMFSMCTGLVPSGSFTSDRNIIDYQYLEQNILEHCPESLEALAFQCCEENPLHRPTTLQCVDELSIIMEEIADYQIDEYQTSSIETMDTDYDNTIILHDVIDQDDIHTNELITNQDKLSLQSDDQSVEQPELPLDTSAPTTSVNVLDQNAPQIPSQTVLQSINENTPTSLCVDLEQMFDDTNVAHSMQFVVNPMYSARGERSKSSSRHSSPLKHRPTSPNIFAMTAVEALNGPMSPSIFALTALDGTQELNSNTADPFYPQPHHAAMTTPNTQLTDAFNLLDKTSESSLQKIQQDLVDLKHIIVALNNNTSTPRMHDVERLPSDEVSILHSDSSNPIEGEPILNNPIDSQHIDEETSSSPIKKNLFNQLMDCYPSNIIDASPSVSNEQSFKPMESFTADSEKEKTPKMKRVILHSIEPTANMSHDTELQIKSQRYLIHHSSKVFSSSPSGNSFNDKDGLEVILPSTPGNLNRTISRNNMSNSKSQCLYTKSIHIEEFLPPPQPKANLWNHYLQTRDNEENFQIRKSSNMDMKIKTWLQSRYNALSTKPLISPPVVQLITRTSTSSRSLDENNESVSLFKNAIQRPVLTCPKPVDKYPRSDTVSKKIFERNFSTDEMIPVYERDVKVKIDIGPTPIDEKIMSTNPAVEGMRDDSMNGTFQFKEIIESYGECKMVGSSNTNQEHNEMKAEREKDPILIDKDYDDEEEIVSPQIKINISGGKAVNALLLSKSVSSYSIPRNEELEINSQSRSHFGKEDWIDLDIDDAVNQNDLLTFHIDQPPHFNRHSLLMTDLRTVTGSRSERHQSLKQDTEETYDAISALNSIHDGYRFQDNYEIEKDSNSISRNPPSPNTVPKSLLRQRLPMSAKMSSNRNTIHVRKRSEDGGNTSDDVTAVENSSVRSREPGLMSTQIRPTNQTNDLNSALTAFLNAVKGLESSSTPHRTTSARSNSPLGRSYVSNPSPSKQRLKSIENPLKFKVMGHSITNENYDDDWKKAQSILNHSSNGSVRSESRSSNQHSKVLTTSTEFSSTSPPRSIRSSNHTTRNQSHVQTMESKSSRPNVIKHFDSTRVNLPVYSFGSPNLNENMSTHSAVAGKNRSVHRSVSRNKQHPSPTTLR